MVKAISKHFSSRSKQNRPSAATSSGRARALALLALIVACFGFAGGTARAAVPVLDVDHLQRAVSLTGVAQRVGGDDPRRGATPLHPLETTFALRLAGARHERRWALVGGSQTARMVLTYTAGGRRRTLVAGTTVGPGADAIAGRPISIVFPESAWDAAGLRVDVRYASALGIPRLAPADGVVPAALSFRTAGFFFIGFFVAIGVFNAMLYVMLRDSSFAWYAFAVTALAASIAWRGGFIGVPLEPLENDAIRATLLWMYLAAVAQFSRVFLMLPRTARRLDIAIVWLVFVNLAVLLATSILGPVLRGPLVAIAEDALMLALLWAGFTAMRGGVRSARFFTAAFVFVVLSTVGDGAIERGLVLNGFNVFRFTFETGAALEAIFLALALADRTQRIDEERRRLSVLVGIDSLTGMANRRAFDQQLRAAWTRAARAASPLALLMIDVDNFKSYNDSAGHVAGDEVLRRIATVLHGIARRPDDTVARYGGEEFAVILPLAHLTDAAAIAERLRAGVEALAIVNPAVAAPVTISIGVAERIPRASDAPTQLVIDADAALYDAKTAGRNRVVLIPPAA